MTGKVLGSMSLLVMAAFLGGMLFANWASGMSC